MLLFCLVALLQRKNITTYFRFDITYKVTELFRGLIVFFFLTPDLFYRINRKSISLHFRFRFFPKQEVFKKRNYNFLLEIIEPLHLSSVQEKWWKRTNVFLIKPVLPAKRFQVLMMDLPVIINMLALKCPTLFVKVAKTRWLEFRKIL